MSELFGGTEFLAPVFAIDNLGRVHFLVRLRSKEERSLVVTFSADGTYSWKVELDRTLWPSSMAVLPSGDFVISGANRAPYEDKAGSAMSFTGIFGKDGRLKQVLKALTERRVPARDDLAETPGPQGQSKAAIPRLEFGDAIAGPDGYVYVLSPGAEPVVEIWSETGERVRELKLRPPVEDYTADSLMVADRSIALRFQRSSTTDPKTKTRQAERILAVYEPYWGEPLRFFDATSVKGSLACFERDRFVFIVPLGDRMALLRVDVHL